MRQMLETLAFYGDVDSYFAVHVVGDRPCGAFVDDVGECVLIDSNDHEIERTHEYGHRARQTLERVIDHPLIQELINNLPDEKDTPHNEH